MSRKDIYPGRAHIGFSGWHNFNIMVQRRSEFGLIVDFNPRNECLVKLTLQLLKQVKSRDKFISRMKIGLDGLSAQYYDFFSVNVGEDTGKITPSEEITKEIGLKDGWLSNDESFRHIQNLALQGRIVAITEDIRNTETFEKIKTIIQKTGLFIDTVYTSNICNYMNSNYDKINYANTVYTLLEDPNTTLIDCPIRKCAQGKFIRLEQRVSSAKEIYDADPETLFIAQNSTLEELSTIPTDYSSSSFTKKNSLILFLTLIFFTFSVSQLFSSPSE